MNPVVWRYVDNCGTHFTEDENDILNGEGIEEFTPLYEKDGYNLLGFLLDSTITKIFDNEEDFLDKCWAEGSSESYELISCSAGPEYFSVIILDHESGRTIGDVIEFGVVTEWLKTIESNE